MESKTCKIIGVICLFSLFPFAIFLNAGTDDVEPETEIQIEDETMGTQYGHFDSETMTNDMEDIREMRNIGYYDDKWWWAVIEDIGSPNYWRTAIYSAPDFTTAKTLETSQNWTFTNYDSLESSGIVCRIYDDNIYVAYSYTYLDTGAAGHSEIDILYSLNGGSTWTTTNLYSSLIAVTDLEIMDVFEISGSGWVMWVLGVGAVTIRDVADTIQYPGSFSAAQGCYAGKVKDDGNYWFHYKTSGGDYKIAAFVPGTNISDQETLTLTGTTNFDATYQQYWDQGGIELILDKDYMRTRASGESAWVELAAASTPSSTNVIIWSADQLRIEYIIWDQYIWVWEKGGAITQLQQWTGDGYIGHIDWFTDGTDAYQYDPLAITWAQHSIKQTMLAAPEFSLKGFLKTFQNRYVHSYRDDTLIAQFFLRIATDGDLPRKYNGVSGIRQDLMTPIFGKTFTAQTFNEITTTLLEDYCSFLHKARGTNGDVNTFTSTQIDANNADTGTCTSAYLAQKTFYNSYSLQNEIFTDLLDQDDDDATGRCIVNLDIEDSSVISFWVATDDASLYMQINFKEGATENTYIRFDSNLIYYRDNVGQQSTGFATVSDYMYHVAIAFDVSADTADIYINGNKEVSAYTVRNNITTAIDNIEIWTLIGDSGYHAYTQNFYFGNSIYDAFSTLDSVSPLPTTTYTFTVNNRTVLDILYLMALFETYYPSWRPDGQLYFDQFASTGLTLTDANYTEIGDPIPAELTPSEITVHYNGGEETAYGSGNGAKQEYWFAELTEAQATALAAAILAAKSEVCTKYPVGLVGGQPNIGTSVTATITKHGITAETMYITDVQYDARSKLSRVLLADTKWSPYL